MAETPRFGADLRGTNILRRISDRATKKAQDGNPEPLTKTTSRRANAQVSKNRIELVFSPIPPNISASALIGKDIGTRSMRVPDV
ncbi:hypothetical protein [Sulfitobacter sp. DSM 110093]|uniref:hypothetical protein n=1 Tax=Sulfitobacter sp. DSM 110093 TaxID=2883127 RepID=UPI001FAC0730|nr:hypothetical protein [Sulfitobacter sp. DSM 110093]